MTINVALVTSDTVVLGCDSIASTTNVYIDPFELEWHQDADKQPAKTPSGKFTLDFTFDDFEEIVTNTWGGVTKLFQIHPDPSPLAAVTSGTAKLCERNIASLGEEFFSHMKKRGTKLVKCEVICKYFLEFLRAKYEENYKGSPLPENLRQGPELLIGGFGRDDSFPSVYRMKVKENTCTLEFASTHKSKTGVAWNAQSDAVERFIRGYDSDVRGGIERTIRGALQKHSADVAAYVTDAINQILAALNSPMPAGINITIPELTKIELELSQHKTDLDYANLPRQEAVNFVAFLVNLQSGKSRFARGVPTVGGRTHIGMITKDKGFEPINEPQMTHKHTGFVDDQ